MNTMILAGMNPMARVKIMLANMPDVVCWPCYSR